MANERITEDIVRQHFKTDPLYNMIKMDEQKSSSKKVLDLLSTASKSWKWSGKPEFLLTFPSQNSNYLIVIECKYSESDHSSGNLSDANKYAVDGVLHYAKFLSKEYNVIAIAVSGKDDSCRISTFKRWQWQDNFEDKNTDTLLSINSYLKLFENETFSENLKHIDIIQKAVYLNDEFQSCSVSEYMRCTIVSAILLWLLNNSFKAWYKTEEKSSSLWDSLILWIKKVIEWRNVRSASSMLNEYKKILNEPLFTHKTIKKSKIQTSTIIILKEMIEYLEKNVLPLMDMDDSWMDVLWKFYTEFVRYAGGSGNVWLVLTPIHVANFFCDLTEINTESVVYDPCTGSWWFLVSAMKNMLSQTKDINIHNRIKENQLIWVESRADMFTYACSNMMFRWDWRSNIYHWDCFQTEADIIKNHKANVSFLNPPYDVGSAGQMEFIEHALRVVSASNWIVVAIVQMSCAIKNEKELIAMKEKLLSRHTLKAVISMPDELFNPAAAVPTCIMVWKAWTPNNTKTWFWYLKDDWFEKRKHKWRIDSKKKWDSIKRNFLNAYKENEEITWLSVKKLVTAHDERLAEAYMETDYSTISENDFIKSIKKYIAFNVIN
jgi:type I restriction enzyme M protein